MAPRTLHRESLSEQVSAKLVEAIQTGGYPPGTLLPPERVLCEQFAVSRTVVREALRSLAAKGLVEIVNGRGALVRTLTDEMLRVFFRRALGPDFEAWKELMIVRRLLEGYSVAAAARARSADDVARLAELIEQMEAQIEHPEDYAAIDVDFHAELARIADNSFIYLLIASIRSSLREIIERTLLPLSPRKFAAIHRFHVEIFRAVEAGDEAAAVDAMNRHFDDVLERLAHATNA